MISMMKMDWDTHFGNSGDPTISKRYRKRRFSSSDIENYYFSYCYFYGISNSGIRIKAVDGNHILLVEQSSFVGCYETLTSHDEGGGAIYFTLNGQSVLDQVCFSYCWSSNYGNAAKINSRTADTGNIYKNYILWCSIANCGKDLQTSTSTMSLNWGQQIIQNSNMSANKCKNNAGYTFWRGDPDSTGKYIIVTDCNSTGNYLIECLCIHPQTISNSFVSIVHNKCGRSVVHCSRNIISFNKCIFHDNIANYGFYLEIGFQTMVLSNCYVSLKTKDGSGHLSFMNESMNLFEIDNELNDGQNCFNLPIINFTLKNNFNDNIGKAGRIALYIPNSVLK